MASPLHDYSWSQAAIAVRVPSILRGFGRVSWSSLWTSGLPSTLRGTLSGKADALYGDIGDMEVDRRKPYSSGTREVAAALSSPGLIHLPSPQSWDPYLPLSLQRDSWSLHPSYMS